MRITISEETYNAIQAILNEKEYKELSRVLKDARDAYMSSLTDKKRTATKTALDRLQEQTKEKVKNAVRLLEMQNKKVNANSVSRESGVHYSTARKYLKQIKDSSLFSSI